MASRSRCRLWILPASSVLGRFGEGTGTSEEVSARFRSACVWRLLMRHLPSGQFCEKQLHEYAAECLQSLATILLRQSLPKVHQKRMSRSFRWGRGGTVGFACDMDHL